MKKLIIAAFALALSLPAATQAQVLTRHGSDDFKLGIAAYTFRKFDLDSTLKMFRLAGVKYMSVKDFHLPLNSTAGQIAAFKQKCAQYGVEGYALGPINKLNSREAVDAAFSYAKLYGDGVMIIGVPAVEMLPYVNEKVKQTGITFAIHTHGPGGKLYRDGEDTWELIKDLDSRIGICLDLGHTVRWGKNSAEQLIKYQKRIFDIHIKDLDSAESKAKDIEMGRGCMDYVAIVDALRKIGYKGVVSLEYEKDPDNPYAGVTESLGYFRGVCDGTAPRPAAKK